ALKAEACHVNERDRAWVDSKLTAQPNGVALQPIRLTGAREKVAKKSYIRAPNYPQPAFDRAFAECKADKSWRTFETTAAGHDVMVDAPDWLAGVLVGVSLQSAPACAARSTSACCGGDEVRPARRVASALPYCGVNPASLTTRPDVARSSMRKRANSSGVFKIGSSARSMNCALRNAGSLPMRATSSRILLMTGLGVPAGASRPK